MPFPLWEKRREERDGALGVAAPVPSLRGGQWLRGTDAETERAQSTEPHAPSGEPAASTLGLMCKQMPVYRGGALGATYPRATPARTTLSRSTLALCAATDGVAPVLVRRGRAMVAQATDPLPAAAVAAVVAAVAAAAASLRELAGIGVVPSRQRYLRPARPPLAERKGARALSSNAPGGVWHALVFRAQRALQRRWHVRRLVR